MARVPERQGGHGAIAPWLEVLALWTSRGRARGISWRVLGLGTCPAPSESQYGSSNKNTTNTSSFNSTAAATTTTIRRHGTTHSRSRNRTASRDRHAPTPSSSPTISSQQWYLASHCLVGSMTKVSFVVRTQAVRRVLSQIRRPRRPLNGPSYQGMATSVKVVALDLSLALALPNRAV